MVVSNINTLFTKHFFVYRNKEKNHVPGPRLITSFLRKSSKWSDKPPLLNKYVDILLLYELVGDFIIYLKLFYFYWNTRV